MNLIVNNVVEMIREKYPEASFFSVSSSDQNEYGFLLDGVGWDDTTVITVDSDDFRRFAEEVESKFLDDLDWGSFADKSRDSMFDVSMETGKIIR